MEIHHKPKPWHGWRDLLKEIGVIVIGVLIALAAEQAVEWFHWRHEVDVERVALRAEAEENLSSAAYRVAEDPCITRRLSEIEEGFRRQAKGQPTGFRQSVSRPPPWVASTGSWDIAVSGQALAHMPRTEKLAFSDAFDTYKAFAQLRNEEDAVWRRLILVSHPEILAPGDWVELHQALGQAVGMNERMKSLTRYALKDASLGLNAKPFDRFDSERLQAFCTSIF